MKFKHVVLTVLTIPFIGCSNKQSKFEGRWKPIPGSQVSTSNIMSIKKFTPESAIMVFFEYNPSDTITLVHDKNTDRMIGYFKSDDRSIQFLDKSGHLLMSPLVGSSGSFSVELEPMKDGEN